MKTDTKIEEVERDDSPSGEIFDLSKLSHAVANAELMLFHATEQGLEIAPEIVSKIVKAKYLEKNKNWTEADEAEFWSVFRDIAKAIQPVTIDSILAANNKQDYSQNWFNKLFRIKSKSTLTRKAVQRYTRYALLSLAIMLIIQIYSLIGTTILNNISKNDAKITEIENEGNLQQELKNNLKARTLELQKDMVADEREKNIELMAKWLRPIDVLLLNKPADLSIFRLEREQKKTPKVYDKINDLGIRVVQSAQHPLLIINSYILPLFYGLLGAYAYVLRILSDEIRTITYSKDSDVKYILRINLGALAGLAVGLLNVSSNSLSPLALAFIAGYSIEFVFVLIDRFIGTITKTRETK